MDRRTPPHRHNTPPHSNTHISACQFNSITTVPPILKEKEASGRSKGLKDPGRSSVRHREQPIAATPLETRLDHVKVMMSQILNLAQDLVEDMKTENNRRRDRSSSRDLEMRTEEHRSASAKMAGDSRIHRTSVLDLEQWREPLLKQYPGSSKDDVLHEYPTTRFSQSIPQPKMRGVHTGSVDTKIDNDFKKIFLPSHGNFGVRFEVVEADGSVVEGGRKFLGVKRMADPLMMSNSKQVQPLAHQVFEEKPKPSVKAAEDDDEGSKSQKPEKVSIHKAQELPGQATSKDSSALQLNHLSDILEIQHVQKVKELKIQFLINDDGLEASSGVKELQNYALDFPELSFEVMTNNWKLEIEFLLAAHLVQQLPTEINRKVAEMEKIGVG